MTNNLLHDWHLRIKFVDDTSALEIIPMNAISLINTAVSDIHDFSIVHRMKLNPPNARRWLSTLCTIIIFYYSLSLLVTIQLKGLAAIGPYWVILRNDLRWNDHVDYIYKKKKTCKKLYSLRILKRSRVEPSNIVKVYLSTIRPTLEYCISMWQAILDFLSNKLETVQKRALYIIYPLCSYREALTNLPTLENRRAQICKDYVSKMKLDSHPLHFFLPRGENRDILYNLRSYSNDVVLFGNTRRCKTKRTEEFVTFKYF